MPTSVYESILTRTQAAIVALNLSGITSNVQLTKLPAMEEEIDTLPLIAVVPADENEDLKRSDFEGNFFAKYHIEIVAISKGRKLLGDTGNTDPNDDLFRQIDWREQVRNLLRDPTTYTTVANVTGTSVRPGKPVNRKRVNQNYDYTPLIVEIRTQE